MIGAPADPAWSQGTGTPAAISTWERRAPFAGDAAGLSPVNFATMLLEVKSLSRCFTASVIKSQLLGELVVPICRRPLGCPRQERAATRSQRELEPDPSPVLNGGRRARSVTQRRSRSLVPWVGPSALALLRFWWGQGPLDSTTQGGGLRSWEITSACVIPGPPALLL